MILLMHFLYSTVSYFCLLFRIKSKKRIRYALMIHSAFVLLMTFRLSVGLCVMFNVRPPRFLQRLNLPRSWEWEYIWWLGSALSISLGLQGSLLFYLCCNIYLFKLTTFVASFLEFFDGKNLR